MDWNFLIFFFFAVPSSVPALEALLCAACPSIPHLQLHSGLILHHGPTPRGPQEDLGWLVGCHPKETLHCCWVTLVVFSSACSDWTNAWHHLLCTLPMAMLATLRGQTEWASPPENRPPLHPSTNPPMWTLWRWGIWSELPQAREEGGTRDCSHHESMAWRATETETFYFLFMQWLMRMRMITDNAMEVHFGLRLLDRVADHAYWHNYPSVNQAPELWNLQCWSSN